MSKYQEEVETPLLNFGRKLISKLNKGGSGKSRKGLTHITKEEIKQLRDEFNRITDKILGGNGA